jgi:hypothetical protein
MAEAGVGEIRPKIVTTELLNRKCVIADLTDCNNAVEAEKKLRKTIRNFPLSYGLIIKINDSQVINGESWKEWLSRVFYAAIKYNFVGILQKNVIEIVLSFTPVFAIGQKFNFDEKDVKVF